MDHDSTSGGEQQSSPDVRTALVDGATFTGREIRYSAVDGKAIVEGDIVLGPLEEVEAETRHRRAAGADAPVRATGIGITGSKYRWPNRTIPYEIDAGLPSQQRVTDAIAHWHDNAPLSFVERTAANANQYPDYVRFVSAGGCSSPAGRQGGRQDIELGPACSTGNCIHEIGHAIGLWHEQSREDRDDFVTIHWENIESGKEHNFDQHISDGDDIGPYDYGSIMHYPRDAFASGGDTITPKQPGAQIGQRTGLSDGDIAAVLALYPSDPNGRWSPWFGLGGICSALSVVTDGDIIDMYVRGQDGTLFQKYWDGFQHHPGPADFLWHGDDFRMLPDSLSVIAAPGFRDVYAIGLDGQLCHKFWDGQWSPWFGLGGVCSAVSVVNDGSVTDIYVRGQDGTLFQKWWDGQRWNPSDDGFLWHGDDFRMLPNSLSVIAAPGFRDVYAIGLDGQLCHKFWDGQWSPWFGLGGICSGVSVLADGSKTDMYVRGQDGSLFQKWWDGRQHAPSPDGYFWHGGGLRNMRPQSLSVVGNKGFRDVYAIDQHGQLLHKFWA